MDLRKGDCLSVLKTIPDKSVDFVYTDLPYGQTACKWDKKIDLVALWVELKRIAKNDRTPFFFSCTTKFGYELIKANEKWFRWDLVWKKNRAAGFLNAYKLPMRKHEMIYCFAKKSPEYDVSSHKEYTEGSDRGGVNIPDDIYGVERTGHRKVHKDPLPTSDITPPTEEHELVYCFAKKSPEYDASSHKTGKTSVKPPTESHTYLMEATGDRPCHHKNHTSYENSTPLPTSDITPSSWCDIPLDNKTGHRTAKPVALMEFLLKYWTKPDWTVLDPTMGSGSMGIACKKMGRKFIGIEMDDDIYKLAQDRIGTMS